MNRTKRTTWLIRGSSLVAASCLIAPAHAGTDEELTVHGRRFLAIEQSLRAGETDWRRAAEQSWRNVSADVSDDYSLNASPDGRLNISMVIFQDDPAPQAAETAAGAPAEGDDTAADSAKPAGAGDGGNGQNLAEAATNPVAPMIQLQLQNLFIPSSYGSDGYANQFIVQPVIPIPSIAGLPRTLWRPTIPLVTTPDLNSGQDSTTGLGDVSMVGGFVVEPDWGMLVLGPAVTFPTATDELLGARQWQLGTTVGVIVTKIPKVQVGGIFWQQWGLGGPGNEEPNHLSIQWLFNYHFDKGWYAGWGDMAWNFDWKGNTKNIPLSARLGRVFAIGDQKVNMFIQPFVEVGGDDPVGAGEWGIKLNLTLLFPT